MPNGDPLGDAVVVRRGTAGPRRGGDPGCHEGRGLRPERRRAPDGGGCPHALLCAAASGEPACVDALAPLAPGGYADEVAEALEGCELVICAIPSHGVRDVMSRAASALVRRETDERWKVRFPSSDRTRICFATIP